MIGRTLAPAESVATGGKGPGEDRRRQRGPGLVKGPAPGVSERQAGARRDAAAGEREPRHPAAMEAVIAAPAAVVVPQGEIPPAAVRDPSAVPVAALVQPAAYAVTGREDDGRLDKGDLGLHVHDLRVVHGHVDQFRAGRQDQNLLALHQDLLLVRGVQRARPNRLVAKVLDRVHHVLLLHDEGRPHRLGPFGVGGQHLQHLRVVEQGLDRVVPGQLGQDGLIELGVRPQPLGCLGHVLAEGGRRKHLGQQRIRVQSHRAQDLLQLRVVQLRNHLRLRGVRVAEGLGRHGIRRLVIRRRLDHRPFLDDHFPGAVGFGIDPGGHERVILGGARGQTAQQCQASGRQDQRVSHGVHKTSFREAAGCGIPGRSRASGGPVTVASIGIVCLKAPGITPAPGIGLPLRTRLRTMAGQTVRETRAGDETT